MRAQREVAVFHDVASRLRRGRQEVRHLDRIDRRREMRETLVTHRRLGEPTDAVDDAIELERL